tara:strand:+ start:139 stop:1299 length:1161 start_codon:yes stop_codon:yes gene_type:complete
VSDTPKKLLFVVNKDEGVFSPSETFLKAHYEGMKCKTTALIGYPGKRCINFNNEHFLLSRKFIPLAFRWLVRNVGGASVASQDIKALTKFLKKEKIDVVLAEYGPAAVSVMHACKAAEVPLVSHFHGWDAYTKYNINTYGEAYKELFRCSTAVIAVSNHMRDQLISLGADPEKTFHNSCGAELSGWSAADPGAASKHFVMVGRLTEKKAPLCSISAFEQLSVKHPDATLEIIGDGPLREDCELMVKNKGLQDKVSIRGAQPHTEVMQALGKARCFIQHSVHAADGDHEGTPVAVIEAMGMGLPVVATRHGGIMDVIHDDSVGLLVDEHDSDGMATAMERFADNAELAQVVGERSRERVRSNWTNEKSIDRLWGIVEGAYRSHQLVK